MLESVKVDELLVDVLTVIPSAAFAKTKIYLLVDRPEDFGCKFLVSGNSVFVLDALLRDFSGEIGQKYTCSCGRRR